MVNVSCSWQFGKNFKIGEKNPAHKSIQINLGEYSCLTEISALTDRYLNSDLPVSEINTFFSCVSRALSRFNHLVEGENRDYFEALELTQFLNREYLPKRPITVQLTKELMVVKSLVLGGSSVQLMRSELIYFIDFLDLIKEQVIALRPYVKHYRILDQLPLDSINDNALMESRAQLIKSTKELVSRFRLGGQDYSIHNIRGLIEELRKFFHWDVFQKKSMTLDQWVELIESHTQIVTGHSGLFIGAKDWDSLSESLGNLYGMYYFFQLSQRQNLKLYGPQLDSLLILSEDVFRYVKWLIHNHKDKYIPFESMNRLIAAVSDATQIFGQAKASSIIAVYTEVLNYVFHDLKKPEVMGQFKGFQESHLNEIKDEFAGWAQLQKMVNSKLAEKLKLTSEDYSRFDEGTETKFVSFNLAKLFDDKNDVKFPYHDLFTDLLKRIRPLFQLNENRVHIVSPELTNKAHVVHNFHDFLRLNIFRSCFRLLIRYRSNFDRIKSFPGVTEDELNTAYNALKPLGVDLDLMDKFNDDAGRRSFMEANHFTFSGNGMRVADELDNSNLMNYTETVEFFALLWSGGKIRDHLYDALLSICKERGYEQGPKDQFFKHTLSRNCFQEVLFTADDFLALDHMPGMKQYIQTLSKEMRRKLAVILESISKGDRSDPEYIGFNELTTVAGVLQYVEVLMTSFDLNANGVLSAFEIMRSYSRFHNFLSDQIEKQTGSRKDSSMVKSIFVFLLDEFRMPTTQIKDVRKLYLTKYRYFSDDPNQFGSPETVNRYSRKDWIQLRRQEQEVNLPNLSITRYNLLQVIEIISKLRAPVEPMNNQVNAQFQSKDIVIPEHPDFLNSKVDEANFVVDEAEEILLNDERQSRKFHLPLMD